MGRVKSLRNGSGAAATAARAGAAVWACRPAAGDESAAALEQQRAMAAIRAIFSVRGCATSVCIALPAKLSSATPAARPPTRRAILKTPGFEHTLRAAGEPFRDLTIFTCAPTALTRLTATRPPIFAAFAWRATSYADKRLPAA